MYIYFFLILYIFINFNVKLVNVTTAAYSKIAVLFIHIS